MPDVKKEYLIPVKCEQYTNIVVEAENDLSALIKAMKVCTQLTDVQEVAVAGGEFADNIFANAKKYIFVEQDAIKVDEDWLEKEIEDGEFQDYLKDKYGEYPKFAEEDEDYDGDNVVNFPPSKH